MLWIIGAVKKQSHMYRMASDDAPLQTPKAPHVSAATVSTIPQQKSTLNAYAKAYEQMVSPQFKAWFGDSEVVDESASASQGSGI